MQIAPIPQDEGKLSKVFRTSSLPFCIFKCLTLFNTNTIENLDIKCLSVNNRGLNKSIKRRSFFRWIHNQNVHFTFLQEMHSSKLSADVWSAEWGGKVFFCHGTTNSKDNNNSQESIFFKAENITPLSLDDQKLCDGPITEAECINAINGFKKDKTPGTDGFSAEFYKFFWPELRTEMLASFHFAFQTRSLSISQRRGVIALIPKKDKDKSLLENSDFVIECRLQDTHQNHC